MSSNEELSKIRIKKALLIGQLEMISEPSAEFYQKLGKIEAEKHLLTLKILREETNITDED